MVLDSDKERVQGLLTQAITILCKNSLPYSSHVSVQGLLGITLDDRDIFLVNIKEVVQSELAGAASESNNWNRNQQSSSSSVDEAADGKSPCQRTLTPTLNRTTNKARRGRKRTPSCDAGTSRKAVCYENIQKIDDDDDLVIVKQEHFGNFCRSPGVETESVETEKDTNFSSKRFGDDSESSQITCNFEETADPIRDCEDTLDNHRTEQSGKHDTDTHDSHMKEEFYHENSLQESGESMDNVNKSVKEELTDTFYDQSESALEYISDTEQREIGQYTPSSTYNQALDYTSVDPSASAMNVMTMMSQGHLIGTHSSSVSWAHSTPTTQRYKGAGQHSQTMAGDILSFRIARKILICPGRFTTPREITRAASSYTEKVVEVMQYLHLYGFGNLYVRGARKAFVKHPPETIHPDKLTCYQIEPEEYMEAYQKPIPSGISHSVVDFINFTQGQPQ